jgi:nucleotide-binding universal stress UspA family protein
LVFISTRFSSIWVQSTQRRSKRSNAHTESISCHGTNPPLDRSVEADYGPKIAVKKRGALRRLIAFVGPAYLVSVGYMDPGNWATDIEGGARFGYMLIWVLAMIPIILVLAVLANITFGPLFRPGREWEETIFTDAHRVADAIAPVCIKHIGVALQHASGDGVIISSAVAEAKVHRARITLLHVVDAPGTLMLGHESWSLHGAEDEHYLESLTREIEEKDLAVEFLLMHGQPAENIVRAVADIGIDMLIMGSHGHRGLDDLVFGQTVSTVRHAIDIPALVVRSYGRERAQRSRHATRSPAGGDMA